VVFTGLCQLASLRTTVATNTCALYTELVVALGGAFDHFVETTLIELLKMAAYTKKIVASQTQAVLKDILINTSPQPRIVIPLLWRGVQDKNVQARQYTIVHVKTYLDVNGARAKLAIETTGGQDLIDKSIRKALGDPNPGVREGGRSAFWAYNAIWKEKAEIIYGTLDTTGRKQLDKAAPDTAVVASTSTALKEPPKKSSVAAAIAASRAKAKQIAADPPTLRHAATAHAAVVTRRSSSPAVPVSPNGPPAASPSAPLPKRSSIIISRLGPSSSPGRPAPGTPSPPRSPPGSSTVYKRTSPLATTNESPKFPAPASASASASVSVSPSHSQYRSSLSARSISPPVVSSSLSSNPRRTSLQLLPSSHGPPTPASSTKDRVKDSFSLPVSSDEDQLLHMTGPGSETSSNDSMPINFSTPFEISQSKQAHDGVVLTPSTMPLRVPGPVVEDALRARAEQAESAAERLLEELAEQDDQPPPFPPSLLPSTSVSPPTTPNGKSHAKTMGLSRNANANAVSAGTTIVGTPVQPPTTPAHDRRAAVLRQVALFQDSPPYKGASMTPSIVDMLKENRHESGWWLKRISRE
jgi:CLIP-associating protein 1/2